MASAGRNSTTSSGDEGKASRYLLGAELGDVVLHLTHVVGELAAADAFLGRILRIEKRLERRLGIDHDRPTARQIDGQVRAQPAAVGEDGRLLIEVAVLHHPGEFHHLAQLDLAPLAAHPRRAQGAHQALRFLLQLLLGVADQVEQRLHARAVVDARLFDLFQLRVYLDERVPDWRDERAELLLPPRQIDRGFAVHIADLLIGQLQEFIRAGPERRGGEGLEGVAQLILLGGAAAGGQQPSGRKARDQRAHDECEFQYSECNSDYRIVSGRLAAGAARIT